MAALFLVRHGQAGLLSEDYDQLSRVGRTQAAALGKWLRATGQGGGLFVRGALRRHRETAEECLTAWREPGTGLPEVEEDAAFDEFDHLDVVGAHRADLGNPAGLAAFLNDQTQPQRAFQAVFVEAVARWTGGRHDGDYRESWGAFKARCVEGMRRVVARTPPSRNAWVFTSGGPIAVLCQHALGLSDERTVALTAMIHNTAVSKLLHDRSRLGLGAFNGIAHLEAMGDASLFTYR